MTTITKVSYKIFLTKRRRENKTATTQQQQQKISWISFLMRKITYGLNNQVKKEKKKKRFISS